MTGAREALQALLDALAYYGDPATWKAVQHQDAGKLARQALAAWGKNYDDIKS